MPSEPDMCIPQPDEIKLLLARREEIVFLDAEIGHSDQRDEELAVIDDALEAAGWKP